MYNEEELFLCAVGDSVLIWNKTVSLQNASIKKKHKWLDAALFDQWNGCS